MKAAIYVRQSLDRSAEGAAVSRQLAECTDLIERNGWEIAEVYRDNDASATKGVRAEWRRLLADLDAGRHDVLVCWHTDRLYRRLRDLADLLEIAERRALRIAAVKSGDLDLGTSAGRFFAGQLAGLARYEVDHKGERQVAANRARAQQGVLRWSRRPFGFDRHGDEIRVVESEAAEIRKGIDAVLAGETLASIARSLNDRGVGTSLGNTWTIRTLRSVITNPRVAGRVVYKGEDMGTAGPAIVDADIYDRLIALLRDPRRKNAPSTTVRHLLSGLAHCGREGCEFEQMLFTTNGAARNEVYRCRRCYGARRKDLVDEAVMGVITARLSQPDAARLLHPEVDVTALQGTVTELRERRDGLAALLADGLLSPAAVKIQAKRLTDQIDALAREIAAATGDSPLADVIGASDVRATLDALPILKLREVIRTLCDVVILPAGKGVRFAPDQVLVRWKG